MTIRKILACTVFVLPCLLVSSALGSICYMKSSMKPHDIEIATNVLSMSDKIINEEIFNINTANQIEENKEEEKMQKLASYISENYKIPIDKAENIVEVTFQESVSKDLDPTLVLSIIGVESTFRQFSKSHAGAVGLTQVMKDVHHKKIKKENVDIWSVHGNIKIGTDILREYIDISKGDINYALQRYNGSTKDKKYKYSKKVMEKMAKFSVASM